MATPTNPIKMTHLVAVWQLLNSTGKDTGDINYADLQRAVQQVLPVEQDTTILDSIQPLQPQAQLPAPVPNLQDKYNEQQDKLTRILNVIDEFVDKIDAVMGKI